MSKNKKSRWYPPNMGQKPVYIQGQIATRTAFYKTNLSKIVKGRIKIDAPRQWDTDYMLNHLLFRGYLIFAKTPAGIIPIEGSFKGVNYWQRPTGCIITAPTLNLCDNERTLGIDCEYIYLERDRYNRFFTFNELINIYAQKLANADCSIDVNLINSRMAYMVEAESEAQSQTIKNAYDRISEGNPLVVVKKNTLEKDGAKLLLGNVKNNYVANDIQLTKTDIYNEFYTIIGINNANTDKKERLITSEVHANDDALRYNISLWQNNLNRTCNNVYSTFPELKSEFSISIEL